MQTCEAVKPVYQLFQSGRSGLSPAFCGSVGTGLLTALVTSIVFALLTSKQFLEAIEGLDSSNGILVTVMNYTGDVLNFGVAKEVVYIKFPAYESFFFCRYVPRPCFQTAFQSEIVHKASFRRYVSGFQSRRIQILFII
jgi:hypothetical protein